jgi:hypothetical protein
MTFTYSGDPAASDKDEVRFLCGDTDSTRPLLSDQEIAFVIGKWAPLYGSNTLNAAVCCEIIAAHYAREVSVSADGVSVGVSELQSKFEAAAVSLRDQYKQEQAMASPTFSGALFDQQWDESIKPLKFGLGFMDNYLAGRQNFGDYDPSEYPSFYPEYYPGY